MSSSFLDGSGASYNASFDLSTGEFNVELSTTSDEETYVQSISISQEALNTLAQSLPVSKIKKINFSANVSDTLTVGSYAFVNFPYLEEIVLPDNVSTINSYAFSGLTKVKTLTLPKYIQKICDGAFDQWTENQTVILPISGYVKDAFPGINQTSAKVYQKEGIKIDKSLLFFNYYTNSYDTEIFCSIDSSYKLKLEGTGGIQYYCRFIAYIESTIQLETEPIFTLTKNITVGSGITVIAPDLFKEMDNLETFTWNNTDDDAIILDSAFLTCPLLSSCTLPEGLTKIGAMVFSGCPKLGVVTPLVIPSTVTSIESTAFTGWTSEQKIKLNMTAVVAKGRFTSETFGSATVLDKDESPITF